MPPPARRLTSIAAQRSRERGQAYAEYLVVTSALIAVLLLQPGDIIPPFAALLSGFRSFFSAYSFTLSLP
ncbi:hypothetical protein bAD24_III04355 [Burkholderia sp. AD24]|nr:hypothetical protein bAD24_III04355 [Burkholderia sp. AD24]